METVLVKKNLRLKSKMDGCFQNGRKKNTRKPLEVMKV